LNDSDELVATAAAVACGKIIEGIEPQALIDAFSHNYYGVRYAAALAIAKLEDTAIDPLIKFLKTEPEGVKAVYAIEALGMTGSKKAVSTLEKFLKSDNPTIRSRAADALFKNGHKKIEKILTKALRNETELAVQVKISKLLKLLEEKNEK